ncbi:MAG: hypothetical protein KGQ77_10470 [Betaproteobacteria bacterium]|nr:hypothetical protein [Betaproteobacteria bacterium]
MRIARRWRWLAGIVALLAAATAHAQVGPPSLKQLTQMRGHLLLQRLMILPPPPGAQPDPQATRYTYSAPVHAQAMHEAAEVLSRSGVSVGAASRLTDSGYFTNAARKYAASIGLMHADSDVAQAVAAQMAICLQAAQDTPTTASQAAQFAQQVQARLAVQPTLAQMSSAERQALAEPVQVQTGLAFWVIQGRKRSSANNNELAYYCGQSLRALGIDLDKL